VVGILEGLRLQSCANTLAYDLVLRQVPVEVYPLIGVVTFASCYGCYMMAQKCMSLYARSMLPLSILIL
jgi:hypothetical protein